MNEETPELLTEGKWSLNDAGIYVSGEASAGTAFTEEMQDDLLALEDQSWWFIYRAEVITGLMEKHFTKETLTADIGGGNGYTSSVAAKKGFYTGLIEPTPEACRHAKARGIHNVCCGTVTDETINDGSVKQFTMLDVLEHIEDDKGFLDMLYKKAASGGYGIITVPAFKCLWSSEDDAAGHFRRYRIKPLCALLEGRGFKVCYRSYFMGFLFLPILLVRVFLEKIGLLKPHSDRTAEERAKVADKQFKTRSPIVDAGLKFFEGIEKRLMRKPNRVLFGSSIIVVVKKD